MTSHRVPIYVSSSTRLNQGQFSLVWNGVIQATAAVITSKLSESATRGYTALTLCKRGPWLKQVPISVNIFLSREMTGNRKQTVRPSAFTTSWFSGNVMLYGRVYVCSDWLSWPPEVSTQISGHNVDTAIVDSGRKISVYHFYWDIYLDLSTVQTAHSAFNPTVCHIEVKID